MLEIVFYHITFNFNVNTALWYLFVLLFPPRPVSILHLVETGWEIFVEVKWSVFSEGKLCSVFSTL